MTGAWEKNEMGTKNRLLFNYKAVMQVKRAIHIDTVKNRSKTHKEYKNPSQGGVQL